MYFWHSKESQSFILVGVTKCLELESAAEVTGLLVTADVLMCKEKTFQCQFIWAKELIDDWGVCRELELKDLEGPGV